MAAHLGPDLSSKRILEVGCGTGYWLRQFIQWGARPENLFGTDLLPERIEKARELCPPGVHLECGDASRLTFADDTFDVTAQVTVFTSILDNAMKTAVAREIHRVLKPRGWLLWYDYFLDNPWNPDVRGIRKKEIVRLFPGFDVHLERVTVAPPLGRILGKISPLAYQVTSSMKVLCTHRLGLIQKVRFT
jgi:SAM-dependent methyltransferase